MALNSKFSFSRLARISRSSLISRAQYVYYRIINHPIRKPGDKIIYVAMEHFPFGRYLYTLLKFFSIEGYKIYIRPSFRFYFAISQQFDNTHLLLKERIVYFAKPQKGIAITLNDKNVSPDYFNLLQPPINGSYHVPMAQHPLMYHHRHFDEPIKESTSRAFAIIMSGNFDHQFYDHINSTVFPNINSRLSVRNYLAKHMDVKLPSNYNLIFGEQFERQVVIVDTKVCNIPMPELRSKLAEFHFYLALPGILMPLCHNVVEAMSVGSIPIIQEGYAALLKPALNHGINAIIFTNLEDLIFKIEYAFQLDKTQVEQMHEQVLEYYKEYLTPAQVVRRIIASPIHTLYLPAEQNSVRKQPDRGESAV